MYRDMVHFLYPLHNLSRGVIMYTKVILLVLASISLLSAGMDPGDSLYVRALLDANELTEVKVGDVVSYDTENGRVFSLYLSNVYTIYGKKVTRLPDDLDRLDTLLYLMVNDAALETLPDAVGNLPHLEIIEVQRNRLKTLPESIGDCPKLEYINISDNELETLPAGIGRLTSLYVLNVSNNLLSSLPEEITEQTFHNNYSNANFDGNYLCNLTGSVGLWFSEHFSESQQNCDLDRKDISIVRSILDEAGLNDVSPEMVAAFRQARVISLNLSSRNISSLPSGVGQLEMLEELILENNKLTDLPVELANLEHLTRINLSRNLLQQVPPVILSCQNIDTLYFDNNDLTDLPMELMRVKLITCRFNRLCNLSDTIETLLVANNGGEYRNNQDCPIPEEGHPLLTIGNSWHYTILQESTSGDIDSLVREIVIQAISPSRDTVFTLERDSGMIYDKSSNMFIPIDTVQIRTYHYSYQRLVLIENIESQLENLQLLINSDWNPEEPDQQIDSLKVFSYKALDFNEDSATETKNLCINEQVGLLGGQLQSENGVHYQVYLYSFNGKVYDSESFREQVNTASEITAVKHVKPLPYPERHVRTIGRTVKRYDLLGRKEVKSVVPHRWAGFGIIIETDDLSSRPVLRLR